MTRRTPLAAFAAGLAALAIGLTGAPTASAAPPSPTPVPSATTPAPSATATPAPPSQAPAPQPTPEPLRTVNPGAVQQHTRSVIFDGGGGERASGVSYHSFRIPSLVRTTKGTLLAFAEGRRHGPRDHGEIDVVLKRSTSDGRGWGPLQIVAGAGPDTWGNPTAVVDRKTGTIWLFLNWNDADTSQFGNHGTQRITQWGQRRVLVTRSDDDGVHWSAPQDMTEQLLPRNKAWDAVGPGNGIQTRIGPDADRLIVPATGRNVYSDDHGKTWKVQGIPGGTSESTVLELMDGTLLRNDRVIGPKWTLGRRRWISRGTIEGGFTPFRPHPQLLDSMTAGSVIRYGDDPSRIVFLNPASDVDRCRMTVRISYDEGATWPIGRLTYDSSATVKDCKSDKGGYSSLAMTRERRIGALIEFTEAQRPNANRSIEFHRFNLAWVVNGAREPALTREQVREVDRRSAAAAGLHQLARKKDGAPEAAAEAKKGKNVSGSVAEPQEVEDEAGTAGGKGTVVAGAAVVSPVAAVAPGPSPGREDDGRGLLVAALGLLLAAGAVRPAALRRRPALDLAEWRARRGRSPIR